MKVLLDIFKHRFSGHKIKTRSERIQLVLIGLMQLGFFVAIVLSVYGQAWLSLFLALIAFVVVWLSPVLTNNFEFRLPLEFEFILNLFIYGSLILGEVHGFYTKFWWWDLVLHASSGLALGLIGFLLLFSLYQSGRLQASPFSVAMFSFCFALALGALWEIFEFLLDSFFSLNTQKNSLNDTMWDLMIDAIGALATAAYGYVYIKHKRRNKGWFHYLVNKPD